VTILDERELTDAERAAIADEPRPGVWITSNPNTLQAGDGRVLDQDRTDLLIAAELHSYHSAVDLEASIGPPPTVVIAGVPAGTPRYVVTNQQRGGIHSDPLVRLLAFRAWGERDRAWRKRDTARALSRPHAGFYDRDRDFELWRQVYGFDGVTLVGTKIAASRGGHQAWTVVSNNWRANDTFDDMRAGYLTVFDELDAKLEAGGEAIPSGPLTFDLEANR
jgi:hypothetical protein